MTTRERFDFVGGTGERLSAVLDRPDGPVRGVALMAHCFTCGKNLHTLTRLARRLGEAGFATFRFDFTGIGSSDGDFTSTSVSTNVADLRRATLTLLQAGLGPCVLIGHSLGGAAVVLATESIRTIDAVVTLAAPSDAAHVRHLFVDRLDDITRTGSALVDIGGRPFPISAGFLADLEEHDVLETVAALDHPLLAVHGTADTVVDLVHAERLVAAAGDGTLVVIEGADHLFTEPAHADELAEIVVTWLGERLGR